jgi:CHAD domain-containing protein
MKIALSAIYHFQSKKIKKGTSHVAVKFCVAVVSMHTRLLQQIQKKKRVSSVELKHLHQMRRGLKELRNAWKPMMHMRFVI